MHTGDFRKSITVNSNAKNNPVLRLSLAGTWLRAFSIEPSSIRLEPPFGKDTGFVCSVTAVKKDLRITGINFKETGKEDGWLSMIPIRYTLTADTTESKKAKKDDPLRYTLRVMYTPVEKTDKYGDFIIRTNIAEKPEVTVSGVILAKKE
jgi:hypothetical protein